MNRLVSLVVVSLVITPTLAAPAPAVVATAYRPDGKLVAFGVGREVVICDAQTGKLIAKLPNNSGRVSAIAFSLSGRLLAVGSEPGGSGNVLIHSLLDNGQADSVSDMVLPAHTDTVYAIAFSPNGKMLATAGYDRNVMLWTLPVKAGESKPTRILRDHSDTVYSVAFHPGGKLLATASADRTVKVWDVETGGRLYTLSDPTDWVYTLSWSPDTKHLAAAGVDKSVRIWEITSGGGKLVHSVFAHERPIWRLGYTSDGKTLFTASEDHTIKAWNTATMVESKVFPPQGDSILGFAVRPDGQQLALGLFDGTALLLDPQSGKPTFQPLPTKPVPPKPEKPNPSGVTRGKTTAVVLTGKDLDQVKSISANSPDIMVAINKQSSEQLELQLSVPPSTPVGTVQLVCEGVAGKAAPITIAIDRYTVIAETGASDSARAAQPVTVPCSVVGVIDRAGDADYYRFEAKVGQQIGVHVVASEVGSKLDPLIVLSDLTGRILAEGTTLLGFTIPVSGTYAVGIRDREYRGGADMHYRMHIGDIPIVTGVFPLALPRGRQSHVHLDGVNLGAQANRPVPVNIPADAVVGSRVPVDFPAKGEKPQGSPTVTVCEYVPSVVDPAMGADIRVPGSADGILTRADEGQNVRFAAKKGQRLIVEVLARRAGSPVDPVVEILDAAGQPVSRAVLRATSRTAVTFRDHDSVSTGIRLETWNDLAINDYLYVDGELVRILALPKNPDDDCQFFQFAGQRLGFLDTTPAQHAQNSPMYRVEIHPPGSTFPPNGLPNFTLVYRNDDGGPGYGKDSRVFFDPPADGTYQARITDARGAAGPNHAYQVSIRQPRPDFSISFSPVAPSISKGGATPLSVTATRSDGFEGPIQLKLEGLPPGLSAPESFIEANQTTTAIALFAQPDAVVPPTTQLKLRATATIDGKELTREATGGLPRIIEPGDIVTSTRQEMITIRPGQETRLVVDVVRNGDFRGRIPLEVRGLPHGVRVLNIGLNGILVTERDTSREVVIYAEPWVQPMSHPIVVLARSERKGTEHAAKSVMLKVQQ